MMSGINRAFNMMSGQIKDFGGPTSGYGGTSGRITSQADSQLDTLARKIMGVARSNIGGKVFSLDVAMLEKEVKGFQPGALKTDNKARDQLVVVRNNLAQMYSEANERLKFTDDQNENTQIRRLRLAVEGLIAETTGAIAVYDRFISTDPVQEAVKNRISATSILSRASGEVD